MEDLREKPFKQIYENTNLMKYKTVENLGQGFEVHIKEYKEKRLFILEKKKEAEKTKNNMMLDIYKLLINQYDIIIMQFENLKALYYRTV